MPQRLHRLEVRNKMLNIAGRMNRELNVDIPPNHIVSREAGYIDVYVRLPTQSQLEQVKGFITGALSREGIGIEAIDTTYERRRRMFRIRFQNDLMLQQAQWGARGMSRRHRQMLGIDADAGPSDTTLVRNGGRTVSIHSPAFAEVERARVRLRRLQDSASARVEIHTGVMPEILEPLIEEQQDEDDTDILSRVQVASVALEQSEIG